MPTYEYECKKCKKTFEKAQSIKAAPIKKCPKCSGKVERIIGVGGGFLLKGSGFYATDYRSKSYKAGQQKDRSKKTTCPKTGKAADCSSCPSKRKD